LLLIFSVSVYNFEEIISYKNPFVLYDKTTFYHRIRVVEKKLSNGKKLRSLFLDTTSEGGQFLNSDEIPVPYQKYWELCKIFNRKLENTLFLGAGSFTMPEAISAYKYNASVEVVEIDPEVISIGYKYFKLGQYPNIYAFSDDARNYISKAKKKYDLIFGDAFNGIRYIPAHLLTLEFFQEVKKRLNIGGTFMINIISSLEGDKSKLFKSVMKTLGEVFTHLYVFSLNSSNLNIAQNIIIVSSDFEIDIINFRETTAKSRLKKLLNTFIASDEFSTTDGIILTDNYNPVEYIVAKTIQ